MLDLIDIESNTGFKIEVGANGIVPKETKAFINSVNEWLEQHRDIKIENNEDYVQMGEDLKKVKGFEYGLDKRQIEVIDEFRKLENQYVDYVVPIRDSLNYAEYCRKKTMQDWRNDIKRKREEEKAEELLKAKEEEDRLKRELETKAIEEQKKAELLTAQRKVGVEKRRELEIQKAEEEKKAI